MVYLNRQDSVANRSTGGTICHELEKDYIVKMIMEVLKETIWPK